VASANRWLRYGTPLQRLREFGISTKEFDLLDETKLTSEQMRICLSCILGGKADDYPHPEIDWKGFEGVVEQKLGETERTWVPNYPKMKRWVSVKTLGSIYGGQSKCSIM